MTRIYLLSLFSLLIAVNTNAQLTDLTVLFNPNDEQISLNLFENREMGFSGMNEAFTTSIYELPGINPQLTLSGDFTGDGLDELALFLDLEYNPNGNPEFTRSVFMICKSMGEKLIPAGTWFSVVDTLLDFRFVDFSVADDYNDDGLMDIALFYNDPSSEIQSIYVMESSGSGFSEPEVYYSTIRNEFNFTALRFACPGDFNGNGRPDIAVFYNYFGTDPGTKQSIFIFESNGTAFTLLTDIYSGIKQDYDFSNMKFARSGDYNLDGYSDIAALYEDTLSPINSIPVFEGSGSGQVTPVVYFASSPSELDFSRVKHFVSGEFMGDQASDLSLFYYNQILGEHEILVFEGEAGAFNSPVNHFKADSTGISLEYTTIVRAGRFIHNPVVSAATWMNDHKGALSFTFDDGYLGAFEIGAAELASEGLSGTFYIFTDTVSIYDAPLAGTSLILEYKNKGFEIGSHTTNHSNLGLLTANQDYDSLAMVLSGSVDILNQRFDQQTVTMSIPFGSFRDKTLEYISKYFYSARSSQYGFNLATPVDFFALRSWPVLSSTSPAFIDNRAAIAEKYDYYFSLMYHDLKSEPFNEDSLIYTYSQNNFKETIQLLKERDLWIDTHKTIYKYIRERNALRIVMIDTTSVEAETGEFSFIVDDGLPDSIFNVELTLRIQIPEYWSGDTAFIYVGDSRYKKRLISDLSGNYIFFNTIPYDSLEIRIVEWIDPWTSIQKKYAVQEDSNILAYPNPFRNETTLTFEGIQDSDMHIIVLDIQGRIMKDIRQAGNESYLLKRNNLPSGMYIIQLLDSGIPVAVLKLVAE